MFAVERESQTGDLVAGRDSEQLLARGAIPDIDLADAAGRYQATIRTEGNRPDPKALTSQVTGDVRGAKIPDCCRCATIADGQLTVKLALACLVNESRFGGEVEAVNRRAARFESCYLASRA
jgi:hypothetical protein